MPHYPPPEILSLSQSATQTFARTSTPHPSSHVIGLIIQLSNYLLGVLEHPTLFGRVDKDASRPSLHTLYDRLHVGRPALSPIHKDAKDEAELRPMLGLRVDGAIEQRALQDFEDLYYVLVARMREMCQTLNTWLASKFISLDTILFPGGPTIEDFHLGMSAYWDVFHEGPFVAALDSAVRESRLTRTAQKIMEMVERGDVTIEQAEPCLRSLADCWETGTGLDFQVLAWSPAMVAGYLEEKYRVVLKMEKEQKEQAIKASRMLNKRTKARHLNDTDESVTQGHLSLKATSVQNNHSRSTPQELRRAPEVGIDTTKQDAVMDGIEPTSSANTQRLSRLTLNNITHTDAEAWDFALGEIHQEQLHREIQSHFHTGPLYKDKQTARRDYGAH